MKQISEQFIIEDLFATSIRRYIPWHKNLALNQQQQQLSLCEYSLENIEQDVILNRIAQLEALENEGFVYVAEKKWLLSYQHNLSQLAYANYADWVYHIFQTVILTKPLKWGIYEDEQGHTSEQYQNIWCAETRHTKSLVVFSQLSTAHLMKSLVAHGELAIEIHGLEDKPHPVALSRAFEFLHDLPYYLELAKNTLCNEHYEADIEGIAIVDVNSDINCSLIYGTDYESGLSIEFKNRKRENFNYYLFEHLPNIKSLIERNLAPHNVLELSNLLASDIIEEVFTSKFRRTLFSYLALFNKDDYRQVVSAIWSVNHRLNDGDIVDAQHLEVVSFSSLLNCFIRCQKCAQTFISDLSFRWGGEINYPIYKVGDNIKWQSQNTGADYYDELFIAATALNKCPHCAYAINHALIEIRDNKILGYSQELIPKLKHGLADGPFISQQLMPIKEFELTFFNSCLANAIANYGDGLLVELKALIEKTKPTVGNSKRQLRIKKYFYDLRHYFVQAQYSRISKFLDFQFFNPKDPMMIGHDDWVKSCCILKDVKLNDIVGDYVFYWGSLLNFPEYYLNDQIQWSEYSVGDENLQDMYLIAHALDEHPSAHRTIRIHLQAGIIADVLPYDSKATGVVGDDFRIAYYLDHEPYLTWKDRYIMRF